MNCFELVILSLVSLSGIDEDDSDDIQDDENDAFETDGNTFKQFNALKFSSYTQI